MPPVLLVGSLFSTTPSGLGAPDLEQLPNVSIIYSSTIPHIDLGSPL